MFTGANGTRDISGSKKSKGPDLSALRPLHDATHRRDQEKCPPKVSRLPGTRREATKKIMSWVDCELKYNTHICWVHAGAGEGKSAIAQEICERLEKKKRLAGSYFWSISAEERSKWQPVAPTLAFQVASAIAGTGAIMENVLKEEPDLLRSYISLANQIDKLVYGPCLAVLCKKTLASTVIKTSKAPYVIVLDGFDQCYDPEQLFDFLDRARKFFIENAKIPLRFIIFGRINSNSALQADSPDIGLFDLSQYSPKEDVSAFVRGLLTSHSEGDIKAVEALAQSSFAVAVPLVEYILATGPEALPLDSAHLDKFYAHTLARGSDLPHSSDIISAFTLLKRPLTVVGASKFLGISPYEVLTYLTAIAPLVHIPGRDDDTPLFFLNEGLREFLLDEARSQSHHIDQFVLKSVVHRYLDLAIVYYEGLSEDKWMLPLDQTIVQCILEWPIHLDLVEEADPTFEVTNFDSRYIQILSRIQFLPLFPEVIAILVLVGANSPGGEVQIIHILTLLQVPLADIELILHGLAPLVSVGRGAANRIAGTITMSNKCSFRHKSIREFLLDPARSHDLYVAPAQYTFISQRFLEIVFAVPIMLVNDRTFFATWPKYIAMAVERDPAYDLDSLEEPFKLLPPSQAARVSSTQAWRDALALVLEPPEVETLYKNIIDAMEVIRGKVPTAFDGLEAGFYLDRGENVNGLTSPRLLGRLISPPTKKASGMVIASRHPVTIVEFLEGFRLLLEYTGDASRFCMPRGSGIGLQVERYPTNIKNNRFLFSLYQYTEPADPESSDSESELDPRRLQDGANPFIAPSEIQEEDRERLIASGSGTRNH